MYIPPHFAESDGDKMKALIEANPFGMLVSAGEGAPVATHLPFLIEVRGGEVFLTAHMARANPHWKLFDGTREALAVFQGPHGYISPNWYASPGRVPTWNYVAVHVTGAPRIVDGARAREMLARLAAAFESGPDAWTMERVPENRIEQLLAAIVAFEMPMTRMEGKWKLSQNMSEADRSGAAAGVAPCEPALAKLMVEGLHDKP
jgi:transcriptional regulator